MVSAAARQVQLQDSVIVQLCTYHSIALFKILKDTLQWLKRK